MPLVGLGVVFVSYSVLYYGITQIRGGNWGLLDLMIPGKFDPSIPTDSGFVKGNLGGQAVAGGGGLLGPPGHGAGGGLQPPAVSQTGPGSATSSGSPGAGITQPPAGPVN